LKSRKLVLFEALFKENFSDKAVEEISYGNRAHAVVFLIECN